MPNVVLCPACSRQLRVPDDLLAKVVRCPACRQTFTATAPASEALPAQPELSPPRPGPLSLDEGESDLLHGSRRPPVNDDETARAEEEYESEIRSRAGRRRAYLQPHRGTLILVLGILSIVVCGCGFLGVVAWAMASKDLGEMRTGRMDREGEATTQAGKICGIIGIAREAFVCSMCCLGFGISALNG
jgi:predicted Zn finger-like uncharacterized protein